MPAPAPKPGRPLTRADLPAITAAIHDMLRKAGVPVASRFAVDTSGHDHKPKGPGGGQFAPKGGAKGGGKAGKKSDPDAPKPTATSSATPLRKATSGASTTPHLTTPELKAVESYKNGGYNPINHELRSDGKRSTGGGTNWDQPAGGGLSPHTAETVKSLDAAFAKAKLDAPKTVYRGYGNHMLLEEYGFDHGMKPGDVLTDKGYVSTSEDPKVAGRWGEDAGYVYAEIRLPAGMSALHLDPYVTHQTREDEVLLPRNTRFKVVSKTPAPGGQKGYKLVLDALPPTGG